MAVIADLILSLLVRGENGVSIKETKQFRLPVTATLAGERDTVSLTGSAFTALSPPSGAKLAVLILGEAVSLTLKGAEADGTGIAIAPASNPLGLDIVLPLGSSPSLGILNGSASTQTIQVLWL